MSKYIITQEQKERYYATRKADYAANPDKYRLPILEKYRADPEKFILRKRKERRDFPERQKRANEAYYNKNNAAIRARAVLQRADKAHRTPKWLSKEDLKEIEQIYRDCKDVQWLTNEPLEVDHIVPLKGKNVSGLHVPWNLRIVARSENRLKSNKFGGV